METNSQTTTLSTLPAPQPASARLIAANRRNAQQSTGPRTEQGKSNSRMNALKHGRSSRPLPVRLEAEPDGHAEYEQLLDELTAAHCPANASERLLVEDIAGLRWQRRRAERAQAALQAQAREALEHERRRRQIELRERFPAVPYAAAMQLGLVTIPDSAGKFHHLISRLETLICAVGLRQFPSGMLEACRSIYGEAPGGRGAHVLAELAKAVEASSNTPPAELDLGALERMLKQELRAAQDQFELYKSEHLQISAAAVDACLAPKSPEWRVLLRMVSLIDRNIERKTRLLVHLQMARRPRKTRLPGKSRARKHAK